MAKKKQKKPVVKNGKKEVLAKVRAKEPLDRVAKAYRKVLENRGKGMSMQQAMLEAGFSPAYAKNSHQLKNTKTWKQLMKDFLPDHEVAETHSRLMRAHKLEHSMFPRDLEDDEIIELLGDVNCVVRKIKEIMGMKHVWYWAADNKAQKDAVDMAYKLKGKYAAEKLDISRPLKDMSDEELMAAIRENKQFLTKKKK
jgi:hypothetical protein